MARYCYMAIMVLFSYALISQVYLGFKEKKGFINIQTSLITSEGDAYFSICLCDFGFVVF